MGWRRPDVRRVHNPRCSSRPLAVNFRVVSSDLKSRLRADLNSARRQRDRARTLVLSTTLSDIRNQEIEHGGPLPEEELVRVVSRAIKQRTEAAAQMRDGGRGELADKEEAEAAFLSGYLPEPLDEAEVRALIREAIDGGVDSIGALMGRIMPAVRGRFDGKEANRIAREELSR